MNWNLLTHKRSTEVGRKLNSVACDITLWFLELLHLVFHTSDAPLPGLSVSSPLWVSRFSEFLSTCWRLEKAGIEEMVQFIRWHTIFGHLASSFCFFSFLSSLFRVSSKFLPHIEQFCSFPDLLGDSFSYLLCPDGYCLSQQYGWLLVKGPLDPPFISSK